MMIQHGDSNVDNTMNEIITLTNNYSPYSQQEIDAVPPLLLNVNQVLDYCGVNNRDQFYGQTASEIIYEEVFDYRLSLIMGISWESVEDSLT